MRQPEYSGQFKRDIKLMQKRHKDIAKLKTLMTLLIESSPLADHYADHLLTCNWKGYRDAHIEPDWLLIYKVTESTIRFERTGSHSDLFG